MPRNWEVVLTKPIPQKRNDFRADFFPRGFHYRHDAVILRDDVKERGGDAEVKKVEQK